jgi:phosphomethylpyrimidine synthase
MSNHTNGNGAATSNGRTSVESTLTTTPFPASQKVYVPGAQAGVRVPMREISLTATKSMNGGTPTINEPITIYDTSGPYTDPAVKIDARSGLAPYRRDWVIGRNDVVELADISSQLIRSWMRYDSNIFASPSGPNQA